MFTEEGIRYSLRNLSQRKGRSLLTLFSILIGITTIFIFISFGLGLYKYADDLSTSSSANKLIILPEGAGGLGVDQEIDLSDNDLDAIKKAGGVYDASGLYFTAADIKINSEQKYSFLISYDPKKPLIMDVFNIGIAKGRALRSGDKKKIVLGYNYLIAKKIFDNSLDVNDVIEINGEDMRIIGFFESIGNPQDDSQVYITNEYFEELYPNATYAEIIAEVDVNNIDEVVNNVGKKLRRERGLEEGKEDFFVQSFDDMIESFSKVLNVIIGFIILIALVSVLVSAINTSNTMITSVLERYKEIGVMKAIGAKNSEIFTIFLIESAFLGFVAGVLGVLLGWGVASLAGNILTNLGWGFLSPFYSKELFIGAILFATLTGAISGAFPAYRASRTNIVDALRYE